MHHFLLKSGALHAEEASLEAIAEAVGTPTYVYSAATLRRHYQVFADAFAGAPSLIAYSVKANNNLAVISTLAAMGSGADVVSGGELAKALAAGVPAAKIVFSGVGKSGAELDAALSAGIGLFNVESEPELALLSSLAAARGVRAPIALRVNPDVAAGGHEKISTGKSEDKFGVPWSQALRVYDEAAALPGIEVVGVDVHIGSQIADLAPFEAAARRVAGLVDALRARGHTISCVDLGGGLGIPYKSEDAAPPPPSAYAAAIRRVLDPLGVKIIVEPGRLIAGNAGVLLTRTLYVKDGESRRFVIVDAGMNDLIRPALYDAWHDVAPVRPRPGAPVPVDVVGPVCESSDRFAKQRLLAPIEAGDLLVFLSAGAYGAVQASEYNARPRLAEVLVDGDRWAVVRPRGRIEDMIAGEIRPDWLRPPHLEQS